jgi:methanogenic corrinoid protein MtbC1
MDKMYFEEFTRLLDAEDKDRAITALDLLAKKTMTLEDLFLQLLAPSLQLFSCPVADKDICIWKEHTRTSIVRTILECTYPFVIKRRQLVSAKNKKVVVVCPSEEYHEIGAIIVNNFFLLAGFDSQYIGANTPKHDILTAVKALKPDFLALSVTNYYNVIVTKQITEEIRTQYPEVKIIVGGQAFLQQGALTQVKHDFYLKNPEDIGTMFGKAYK